MPDPVGIIDVDPQLLASSVAKLEARVAALETALARLGEPHGVVSDMAAAPGATPAIGEAPSALGWTTATVVTLAGRTLVALGGGYLLRALTDGGTLPPAVGVFAGLLYALFWIALSVRAAASQLRPSATFHALTAALVGFPLLWEATTRFALFGAASGAVVVAVFAGILLIAARRTGIEATAWFGALGATGAAVALAVNTSGYVPYTLALAGVGVGTLWLGYLEEWTLLRWPVAAVVDLMVVMITISVADADVGDPWAPAVTAQLFILSLYLGSFVSRALLRGREVILFEVVQSAGAMAACFGGALWIFHTIGITPIPLGLAALALGPAAYAFAFLFAERAGQHRNVAFFGSLALAFTIAGLMIVLPRPLAVTATTMLALATAEWARRSRRVTLGIHALIAVLVGAVVSGLAAVAWSALTVGTKEPWPTMTLPHAAVLLAVVAVCLWPVQTQDVRTRTVSRFAAATILAWIATGAAIAFVVPLVMDPVQRDAGAVATIRTVLLVAAAGVFARPSRSVEYAWLSYGLLGLVGFKLVTEDLLRGRPATLFVALAVYGAALIVIPRVVRNRPGRA